MAAAAAVVVPAWPAYAQTPAPQPERPAPRPAPAGQGGRSDTPTQVEGVTVTGARPDVRTSVDRLSYNVANDLQSATGTIADALRNVPGVEVDPQGAVSLRGDPNVTILIDGRPSAAFRGEARADALQQLPANQIERVEVITNPSAAMSPEGTGGVINLVTKATRRAGRTGSVRGSIGTEGRANASVSATHAGPKLTVSGSAGYRKAGGDYTEERERVRLNPATGAVTGVTVTDTLSNQAGGGFGNGRLAADYDVNPRDRLSAEGTWFSFGLKPDGRTNFTASDAAGAVQRSTRREFENEFSNQNRSLRGSWRRRLSGQEHELTADFTLNMFDNENDSLTRELSLVPVGPDVFERYQTSIDFDEPRAKLEYAKPLPNDRKLRVGYEGAFGSTDYDFRRLRGPTPDALAPDTRFTNRFAYEQDVHAAYGTYERPFGDKFTAQFGLRLEQVDVRIDQITTGVQESNDYFRVYPTLNLGYELSETQRLRAGYSRRVQRPQPFDLNPFPIFVDEQNQRAGNPRLRPEVTDSFEASWQYRKQQSFYLATLYYRHATDGITDVIRDLGDGVFLTTRENLAESRRIGLELTANGRLTPKLTYNASVNVAHAEIEPTGVFGITEARSGTIVGGRLNVSWTPTDKDFVQVSGFMQGEQLQAQGVREAMGMLNLGYRRKIDDKLSLVFSGQNVLDTFNEKVRIDTPGFRDRVERRFLAPAAYVGFIYNFGGAGTGQQNQRRPEPTFEYEQGGTAPPPG